MLNPIAFFASSLVRNRRTTADGSPRFPRRAGPRRLRWTVDLAPAEALEPRFLMDADTLGVSLVLDRPAVAWFDSQRAGASISRGLPPSRQPIESAATPTPNETDGSQPVEGETGVPESLSDPPHTTGQPTTDDRATPESTPESTDTVAPSRSQQAADQILGDTTTIVSGGAALVDTESDHGPTVVDLDARAGSRIYDDKVSSDWLAKPLASIMDVAQSERSFRGDRAIAVTTEEDFRGIQFHYAQSRGLPVSGLDVLSFSATASIATRLKLSIKDVDGQFHNLDPVSLGPSSWSHFEIPLTDFSELTVIDELHLKLENPGQFFLDEITLIPASGTADTIPESTALPQPVPILPSPPATSIDTTPLGQPVWLDGSPETYQYTKLGVSYDPRTYFTNFEESRILLARNSAELAAHVNTARADSSIDAIYLDPAAGIFDYPRNLLAGLSRPTDRPLVIRTLPGAASQAAFTAAREDRYFQGVAYVDVEFVDGLSLHGGGRDILIERCVGRFDLQGQRENNLPTTPLTNLQFRLNLVADAWTPTAGAHIHGLFAYNTDGLLLEGNIFDHNGWDPTGTRATPAEEGGPTARNHNIYLARPGRGQVVRFNYIARGSSHGIHFRNGGHLHDNLFVRNPIAWQYGYGGDSNFEKYGLAAPGAVEQNITLDSDDINTSAGILRGIHAWITNVVDVTIDGNVAIDNTTSRVNDTFLHLDRSYEIGATLSNNTSVNWPGALRTGAGSEPLDLVTIDNHFDAFGLTSSAQALADRLKNDAYIDKLRATRARLGVDIDQLKADMEAIRTGIIL